MITALAGTLKRAAIYQIAKGVGQQRLDRTRERGNPVNPVGTQLLVQVSRQERAHLGMRI